MDPNAALQSIRAATQEALRIVYSVAAQDRISEHAEQVLTDLAEGFDNLDVWMTRGGFLPDDWRSK